MCGLAGYINLSNSHCSFDRAVLNRLQETLYHRGPDGYSIWKSAAHQAALVFRRLSIVDLSNAGMQPMLDPEQTVVISFNGEIYNHQALRQELELLGYRYRSNSDTETLLYAYKAWGINFIHRLEGMFAIALIDLQSNELYLIRDRIGVKPLYFSLQGGYLSFASEIKALWQLPWVKRSINTSSLYHYLTYMATPAPTTMYDGVYKLPASFYAKVDAAKKLTFHEWYTPFKDINKADRELFEQEQFCVDGIRKLLRESVKKRMMADVPIGVFLSGGIDSSLNVALMAEYTDRVKTFNVSFSDGPEYDEAQWARTVARRFNTDHHEITISESDAFSFFQSMVYHQDEPLADCVCIPLYYVSKLCKESGVTVVQVGEGSDELFCGYGTYARYIDMYNRYWKPSSLFLPAFAKKSVYAVMSRLLTNYPMHLDMVHNWALGKHPFWTGAMAFSDHGKQNIMSNNHYKSDPILDLIYPGLSLAHSYGVVEYHLKRLHDRVPNADFYTSMVYLELKQRLPELLLMRVDKMTMATSVEGRVPFLDHAFVEFALNIPTRFKYHQGVTKYILKKAAEEFLPHDIIYRKKMGFAAPTKRWFKQGAYFKPYFMDMLATKRQVLEEYFNIDAVEKMVTTNQKSNRDYSVQLWTLQNVMALDGME
jgi:asparagine synthase (glutamine-hydrolysing)